MGRLTILSGAGIGAALMYLFDPEKGRRRRALLGDQIVSLRHDTEDAVSTTFRDLSHRVRGLGAGALSGATPAVGDAVIAERVRARLGRLVRHPGAIEVDVREGYVTLSGPILTAEAPRLIAKVRSIRGVCEVVNDLELHEQPGDVPALQGQGAGSGEEFELFQTNWSPSARLGAGLAGAVFISSGLGRRGLLGIGLSTIGFGLLARALANRDLRSVLGLGGGWAIDVQKTINVSAPVEQVFKVWSHPENFPRFMGHLKEVRQIGTDRYRWTVAGPAGAPFNFEAQITKLTPNEVVAWKTMPGSSVGHAGLVRFDRNLDGTTRVSVRMSYSPPAGAIGHAAASLFGVDPKRAMDDDLARLKSLIEEGKATAHGETVTLREIAAES